MSEEKKALLATIEKMTAVLEAAKKLKVGEEATEGEEEQGASE